MRFVPMRAVMRAVIITAGFAVPVLTTGHSPVAAAQNRSESGVLTRESLAEREAMLPKLRGQAALQPALVSILRALAVGYADFAEYDKALAYATEAQQVARKLASPFHQGMVGVTLGNIHRSLGDLALARQTLDAARQALERVRTREPLAPMHLGDALVNLGLVDAEVGRYESAIGQFEQAGRLYQEAFGAAAIDTDVRYQQIEGKRLSNLAHVLVELGRPKEAMEHQRRAVVFANRAGDRIGVAIAREFLGTIFGRINDHQAAIAEFEQVLASARQLGHRSLEASALHGMAAAQARSGRASAAEESYRRANAVRDALGQRGQAVWYGPRVDLASLLAAQGRTSEAATLFEEAVGVLRDRMTTHVAFLSEAEQLAFRDSLSNVVDAYFRFSVGQATRDPQATGRMFDVLLWEKGFVVTAATRLRAVSDAAGANALSQQLAATRRAASTAARAGDAAASHAAAERALEIERQLAAAISAHRGEPVRTVWRDVQRALQPRQAAVEIASYAATDAAGSVARRVVALVVRPDAKAPTLVDLGTRAAVQRALDDYVRLTCVDPEADAGREATKALWIPIAAAIGNANQVTIAADEALHTINWNILPLDARRQVIDAYDVRVVGSTRDLLKTDAPARPGRAVIVADPDFGVRNAGATPATAGSVGRGVTPCGREACPATWTRLKGTADEAQLIEPILAGAGWKVDRYLGQAASEADLKRTTRPGLLHVATHGCFGSDSARIVRDPMLRSYLALAGVNESSNEAGREDGALTAYEAAGLDLHGTQLVVLSACETGLGVTSTGEGVFGLRRAFQLAGARAVLMTLWQVPDSAETVNLIGRFYTHWTGGLSKRAALRRAQREQRDALRASGKGNPFWWGAFVLVE